MRKMYIWLLGLLLLSACAQKGLPPGGPVDKTPPAVVRTLPEQRAVNVPPDQQVEIEFSEPVRPATLSQSVFFTPFTEDNADIRIRGRLLTIAFKEPPSLNTTCVITLGTGIKDYRNNAMERSYSLAFSTGAHLDEGRISGRVRDEKDATGINIWAYRTDSMTAPDPARTEPDYTVQCSKNGAFSLSYLAPGTYRLFAVKDRAADRLYQPVEDRIGLTTRDAVVRADSGLSESGFLFRMTAADTAGPAPVKADAPDDQRVRVVFKEPITFDTTALRDSLWIAAADTAVSVPTEEPYIDRLDERVLHIPVSRPMHDQNYRLRLAGIFDNAGNPIPDSVKTVRFRGSAVPDTVGPTIQQVIPAPGTLLTDPREAVSVIFSEALDSALVSKGTLFSDTLGNVPPGSIQMPHPMEIRFSPSGLLPGGMKLVCTLSGDFVRDRHGNEAADSVLTWTVVNPDTFSSISGSVADADTGAAGPIHLSALQLPSAAKTYALTIPGPGPYRFEHILPGIYVIEGFRDEDGNGTYSYGTVLPWKPAERFFVHPDTIKIRSRWPNEGNDLIIK